MDTVKLAVLKRRVEDFMETFRDRGAVMHDWDFENQSRDIEIPASSADAADTAGGALTPERSVFVEFGEEIIVYFAGEETHYSYEDWEWEFLLREVREHLDSQTR